MQAIRTEYKGPTNSNGSRINARCEAGRLTWEWDHAKSPADNHTAAALALFRKLGWADSVRVPGFVSGSLGPGSYVHVLLFESETHRF